MCHTEKKLRLFLDHINLKTWPQSAENHEQMNTDSIGVLVQNPYALSLIAHVRAHPQSYLLSTTSKRDSTDMSTVADSTRTVHDDQDDEMPEPTQMSSAEKTKDGRNSERVTGITTHNLFVTRKFITAW